MFIWYIFILACPLTGSNPNGGLVKIARISLRLTHELCRQYYEFEGTTLLPSTPVNSSLEPRKPSTGEVKWARCDPPKECLPFRFKLYSESPGHTEHERIVRHPVTEYSYPALIAIERAPWKIYKWLLQGHGVLIDNVTMLTSASNLIMSAEFHHSIKYTRFKMGGSNRKMNKTDAIYCLRHQHPKWDRISKAYNFGLIHFKHPIHFTENIKPMQFAKKGQEIKGPCRYASWTKYNVRNGFHLYTSDLMEASVRILPDDECQKAGFPTTHICTAPLLCGLQDSGAPLICSDKNVEFIYALSSHYIQDYEEPKFCGGHSLSSFTKITEMDWDWVKEAQLKASLIEYCKR